MTTAIGSLPTVDLLRTHGKSDFLVIIKPKSNRLGNVSFYVKGHRITCDVTHWQEMLSSVEKEAVFNRILGEYHESHSLGSDGFFSAAIAVTPDDRIFIHENTQRQDPYHKDCAEVNVIKEVTGAGTFEQHKVGLRGEERIPPKIKELHLMVNKPGTDKIKMDQRRPLMPCGKCLDAIENTMERQSKITAYPANDGTAPIVTNNNSLTLHAVGPYEAWQTNVGHLLAHQEIKFKSGDNALINQGETALWGNSPLPVIAEGMEDALAEKAAQCAIDGRRTIPVLELDSSAKAINHYLVQQLQTSIRERTLQDNGTPDKSQVERARMTLIRLEDGTFHDAIEIRGPKDHASPHSAITAISVSRHTTSPIAEVWEMEYNPIALKKEEIHTMAKEAVERLYKRSPKNEAGERLPFDVHFIPFNHGILREKTMQSIYANHTHTSEELFPSAFLGAAKSTSADISRC